MFEATASAAGADGKALLATLASAPAAAESEQLVDILCALDGRRFLKHELTSHVSAPLASSMEEILYTTRSENIHQRLYLRAYLDQVPAWRANLQPVLEQLGSMTGRDFCEKNVGIWVSSAGCETPLHFDLCHGFLVQCTGRKTFLLAPPSDTGCLYWSADSTAGSKNRTTSPVDLFAWTRGDEEQQKRFPEVDSASFRVALLEAGSALYTPPGWWHAVISETASVSVLVPFDPDPESSSDQLPHNALSL